MLNLGLALDTIRCLVDAGAHVDGCLLWGLDKMPNEDEECNSAWSAGVRPFIRGGVVDPRQLTLVLEMAHGPLI